MKTLKITFTIIGTLLFLLVALSHIIFSPDKGINKWDLSKAKIAPIETAIDAYYINTGQYPKTLGDLIVCPQGLEDGWKGPYLKRMQIIDPWDNLFIYKLDRYDPNSYVIISYGKDGKPGGKCYNADVYND